MISQQPRCPFRPNKAREHKYTIMFMNVPTYYCIMYKQSWSVSVWGTRHCCQSQYEDQTILVSLSMRTKQSLSVWHAWPSMIHAETEWDAWSTCIHSQVLDMSLNQLPCAQTELNLPIPVTITFVYFLWFASPSISDNPVHSIEAKDDTNINNALYRLSRHYFYLFSFCFLFMLTFQILFSLIFLPGTHFSSLHVTVSGQSTSCKGIIIISLYVPQIRGAATKKWLFCSCRKEQQ